MLANERRDPLTFACSASTMHGRCSSGGGGFSRGFFDRLTDSTDGCGTADSPPGALSRSRTAQIFGR